MFVTPDASAASLGGPRAPRPAGLAACAPARLEQLVEQIGRINSALDPRALLESILAATARILESEASSLFRVDEADGDLWLQLPTGPARHQIEGLRIPAGRGVCGWVAREGRAACVNDPGKDPRFFGDLAGGFVTRNLACVPIRRPGGRVVGVLQAVNRRSGSFTDEDMELLAGLADQASLALERERHYQDSLERTRLEEQLQLAQEIQNGLWPQAWSETSLRMAGLCRPAGAVGGDYFDHFTLPDGRVAIALGDVCGKGPAAALLMCTLRSALRAHLEHPLPLEEVMARVNRSLVRDTPTGRFSTLFCALLDPRDGRLEYVNGGHNPPMLVEPDTGFIQTLEMGGPLLGAFGELEFQVGRLWLGPGQALVAYSDGVTEALNSREEEFGEERLRDLLLESALEVETLPTRVFAAVDAFADGYPQFDDLTLLALRLP
jgi:serine phosphatase RsbU (regulator of sigma subunit)